MIIICGNSITEVERDLEMAKIAMASGKPIGIGGATPADVEQALDTLKQYMGGTTATPCGGSCGCPCNGCMTDEEDICPECGEHLDALGFCENCGYFCEEEEIEEEETDPTPSVLEFLEALASGDMDKVSAIAKRLSE